MDETALYEINLGQNIIEIELPGGTRGERGEKGDTGPQGEQGPQGIQGIPGPKGDKGDKGDTGNDGISPTATVTSTENGAIIEVTDVNGTTTATISNGDKGEPGSIGPQGPKGDKGDKGDAGASEWGQINGTLSNQTDLQDALDDKQNTLVSGTNIKTINNESILGSGNINIQGGSGSSTWGSITGTLSDQTDLQTALNNKANTSSIPTKTSDLTNDSGYITSETDPVFNASAAKNITSTDITNWNNKSNFSGSYNDLTNKPTLFSGNYNDLINKPTIPDSTSDLTNDSGFITNSVSNLTNYYTKTETNDKLLDKVDKGVDYGDDVYGNIINNSLSGIKLFVNNAYDEEEYTNVQLNENKVKISSGDTTSVEVSDGEAKVSGGELVVDSIRTKNMFDKNNVINGYRFGSDGALFADGNYSATDYIKVKPSTTYTYTRPATGGSQCICLYDNSKTFISRTLFSGVGTYKFTTTSATQYVRIAEITSGLSANIQLEEGSTATPYSPYQNLDKTLEVYSTTETIIGTWIDGKPLYRKVIEATSPSSENTNTNIYTITENMENVIDLRGYIYASNPSYKGGINVFITSNDYISTWILTSGATPTNIRCRCSSNRTNSPMKIIMEYTKTTD